MMNQQQQQQPIDIMGLADKAASAVQALNGANPHLPTPYQQQQSPQFQQQPQPGYVPPGRSVGAPLPTGIPSGGYAPKPTGGRRSTATIHQLPTNVQYMVMNIQTSGSVEGTLDEGILGMLHDLPEPMARAALEKFNRIDKTSMRNKTAYLAGMLRRELESINKR